MPPLCERPRGGISPPVIGFVKARTVRKVERQLLRLDCVRAADDVILLAVGMICAGILPCRPCDTGGETRNRRSHAVVDLLAVCKVLRPEECLEQRHGLTVVDAPRRPLAALGVNVTAPFLVCLRLLHIVQTVLFDIGHCSISLLSADALPDQSAVPIFYTALLPYGMVERGIVQKSHNAADVRIPLSRSLLHVSRLQGVLNAAVILYRSPNAAEHLISYDLARIPDVLNGG